ncbi:MAG TPA: carboxypeptidase-like regulatory domain-containing protein, partial [Candidatus Sumerlaeota bacterium]|nr:carboxypeptidase-like regulatory domain-containing protein [Candidatus Sumerlaeota bacterium]
MTALTVRVVWKDTGTDVPQANLTLTPLTDAQATSTGKVVTAKTQANGEARLAYPMDRYPVIRIEVRATPAPTARFQFNTRAAAFSSIANGEKPLRLELQRLYGLYGTVYASGEGHESPLPEPDAEVALASQEFGTTTTRTDAAGRYEFRRVSGDFWRLAARAGNRVTCGRDIALKGEGLNGPFDLYLKPGVSVTALVNDKASLLPIPGATVEACYGGELRVSARTNVEGFADLPALPIGLATLTASAPGYQAEKASLDITGSMKDVTIFSLKKGGKALIRTVDEKNAPVPEIHLSLNWAQNVEKVQIQTDEKGECRVEGLPLNTGIWVGFEQGAQGKNRPFALFDANEKEVRVVVTRVESPKNSAQADLIGWVGGTVVDENKQPVAGAVISLYTAQESCVFEDARTVTDTSGHFRLENLKCRKLAEGQSLQNDPEMMEYSYTEATQPPTVYAPVGVMVSAEGYSMTISPIRIGTEREIILAGKGDFKGRVVDKETDQPIP